MAKSLSGPASVPAVVRNPKTGEDEHCVYLTSPSRPNRAIVLPKSSGVARVVGENPLDAAKRTKVQLA